MESKEHELMEGVNNKFVQVLAGLELMGTAGRQKETWPPPRCCPCGTPSVHADLDFFQIM